MYMANKKRAQMMESFADYSEYLKSLEMEAVIGPFEQMYVPRISQLTNKSNQFNLTTKRYNQDEIAAVAEDTGKITLCGRLKDKFGDNGIVSLVIGSRKGAQLHIDLWLMSCRVLKRDMEYAMLDSLIEAAAEQNISEIYGYFYPTAKNKMVKEFYSLMGFDKISEDAEGNAVYKLDISKGYENKNHVIMITHGER